MPTRNPKIDAYIAKAQPFARPILRAIREAVHAGCPEVEETLKWSSPAFMYKGLLCLMAAFKQHVTFGFWRGSAIPELRGKEQEAMGNFGRVTSLDDLPPKRKLVQLVKQAAALHDAGVKPARAKTAKPPIPEPDDFVAALRKNKKALETYEAFPPSHKREYLEWITGAKREETRKRRLQTAIEWMAEGKPHNWKYL